MAIQKALLLFFLVIALLPLEAQNHGLIKGRVVDAISNEPIAFVTVWLKSKEEIYGLVTNFDGDFQLPVEYRNSSDSVLFSCIGYLTKKILPQQLMEGQLNILKLSPSTLVLNEVTVVAKKKKLSADQIVSRAIERITQNCMASPYSYVAYYRDYQLMDSSYLNLNEGIVEVFDQGITSNDAEKTKLSLRQYKRNTSFQRDSTIAIAYDNKVGNKFIPGATIFPFGGNELAILRIHDAIRNYRVQTYSFVNQLSDDFIKNHFFKMEGISSLDNVNLYRITFSARYAVTGANYSAEGTIYIEKGNYAIHKLEYSGFFKDKLLYRITVEYARHQEKMTLNYISFYNIFDFRKPDSFKVLDISYNPISNAFQFQLSHQPELGSALDINNYDLRFDGKKLRIKNIQVLPPLALESKYRIQVFLTSNLIPIHEKPVNLAARIKAEITNVKDLNGEVIHGFHLVNMKQFRELFVENLTPPKLIADSLTLDKNRPLDENQVKTDLNFDVSKYWMNTPLKR
ncbi:MAG: carboxypeptidase-like regulatory domain-containing protein [Bacteroidetes bacterium]|nr:carboxypeptidase-like regulatory domain-containing protein [Bacteroidota bacterium]MBS1540371.1 carboxypeptidase-like regulatory domain-containing protein [Bacteroidota bacterium]